MRRPGRFRVAKESGHRAGVARTGVKEPCSGWLATADADLPSLSHGIVAPEATVSECAASEAVGRTRQSPAGRSRLRSPAGRALRGSRRRGQDARRGSRAGPDPSARAGPRRRCRLTPTAVTPTRLSLRRASCSPAAVGRAAPVLAVSSTLASAEQLARSKLGGRCARGLGRRDARLRRKAGVWGSAVLRGIAEPRLRCTGLGSS
jgi:hypothetical protein